MRSYDWVEAVMQWRGRYLCFFSGGVVSDLAAEETGHAFLRHLRQTEKKKKKKVDGFIEDKRALK